jgi:hypothetical protein
MQWEKICFFIYKSIWVSFESISNDSSNSNWRRIFSLSFWVEIIYIHFDVHIKICHIAFFRSSSCWNICRSERALYVYIYSTVSVLSFIWWVLVIFRECFEKQELNMRTDLWKKRWCSEYLLALKQRLST